MSSKQVQLKPNPKQKGNKRKATRKRPKSFLLLTLGLTGVALFSAVAGAILALSLSATPLLQSSLSKEEESVFNSEDAVSFKNLNLPQLTRPVNILILGTKVLTSEVDEPVNDNLGYHSLVNSVHGLSDTMVLLRFDPEQHKFTALSIPRDTQTEIPGYGVKKINEANYYGGPALAAETISHLLDDVKVDRYLRINIQAVEKFIDALGGVNVYVPKDMKYTDESQHLYINLKQGNQHLDGAKAIQFLRFRHDEYGDIGRIQRQQVLMRAVVEQALKPATILRIPKIVGVIQSYIDTNLSVEELVALGSFAAQTNRSDVQMLMLPGYFSGDGKKEVSYWIPKDRSINRMMAEHFQTSEYEPEYVYSEPQSVRIAIQDSTGNPEAVQSLVNHLQQSGYNRVFVGKDWQEPLAVTKIVAQSGDDTSASAIKGTLGLGEVLVESTGVLASDVTIQLGKDWQQKALSLE